jgi:hypothetical protein
MIKQGTRENKSEIMSKKGHFRIILNEMKDLIVF